MSDITKTYTPIHGFPIYIAERTGRIPKPGTIILMKDFQTSDPRAHANNIKSRLEELAEHIRKDIGKVEEPQAKALFETSAEVLHGLIKAYSHYGEKSEEAWK